jgi:hypothetical protein
MPPMDLERIRMIARGRLVDVTPARGREPGALYYHGQRVARTALDIASAIDADGSREVLAAAAMLHDLAKGGPQHAARGAKRAYKLLKGHVSPTEREQIRQIILNHNNRGARTKLSTAVRIVQDADLLDHFGPTAVWAAAYRGGVFAQPVDLILRAQDRDGEGRERRQMSALLNFEPSRAMFEDRMRWEERFLEAFRVGYETGAWRGLRPPAPAEPPLSLPPEPVGPPVRPGFLSRVLRRVGFGRGAAG